jgi:8-oxo-dGTP diphosphatase
VSRYRVLDHGREAAKTVQWWAMRAEEGEFVPCAEVDALRWLPLPSALARVSSGYDCGPLTAFGEGPADTTSILLVRHGSAGDRATWDGPDDARPLDERGRAQAAALADLLPAYRPALVLAATPLRCEATVQPAAERLGLPVEPAKEATGDERTGPDLAALLTGLAREGRPAVVCAQGGGIETAVHLLTGRPVEELRARKGSLWALSFSGTTLVDAEYTASLL